MCAALWLAWAPAAGAAGQAPDSGAEARIARGLYLARAAGCVSCHTDEKSGGAPFAGGRALTTDFGTFYSPNITPHPEAGIGRWSDAEFLRALKMGEAPDGSHYFPAFPYTSYTKMRREDALAIKAYLFSLPPAPDRNRPHEIAAPFGWRWLMGPWKWLFFETGAPPADPSQGPAWHRGAYLVEALAHCGECHTPRNVLGALDRELWLAGTADGPEGELAPNITPDGETGIGDWSEADITMLLREGLKPNFDDVQGTMAEAIEHGLQYLSEADLEAIAVYLKALPPIEHRVHRGG